MHIQPLVVIPLLRFAPHYSDSGVKAGELMKADSVLLSPQEYADAIAAMTRRLDLPA
jgi:hypothetical protein